MIVVNSKFALDPNRVEAILIRVITTIASEAVSLIAQSGMALGKASVFVA